ncbi:chain-length determining protein [Brevundimonas naejangsanensis]|uniref:Chain-length determining protein n=1 Tax=Brevundimonas naejangsanensis TaxID=588932 RepID=A0A494RKZ7_9CAUL|nr:chain-length determining protein [Brevundimonas naejangsanensis]AYG96149.1 chain-length determining protein [Brevundimonas naejangsanensis]
MRPPLASARPRYGVIDVVALLFRELVLMTVIFVVIVAVGAVAVLSMKKTYTAGASLFVGVGQEYVYQPRVGMGERAMPPSASEVAQSEAAILNSLEVKRRVVRALGVESFQDGKPSSESPARQEAAAIRSVATGLGVEVTPLSPVVGLSYKSADPAKSARVLNTVIDQYLTYRREVFQDRATSAIRTQRQTFEQELADADRAYEEFLRSNDIGDFATAKASLTGSYQTVFAERMAVQAQLRQAAQRLATLAAQQARTPAEVALHQDLNVAAQDLILQLRTERESLLARYQPDAQPVREIEGRIAQLQAYVGTGTAVGAKEVRTGPNPVWIELETTRINAQAERDALAARLAVLDRQVADLTTRQARLTELESRNSTLAGNREVLTASIREFQQRETQSRADNELVKAGADNVTVIERAQPPSKGKSLRFPLMVAVLAFAGFTALCVGLLRVFLRRGFAMPLTLSRTLQAPVLAVAPAKGV